MNPCTECELHGVRAARSVSDDFLKIVLSDRFLSGDIEINEDRVMKEMVHFILLCDHGNGEDDFGFVLESLFLE